jgi:hypothetical protein
MSASWAPPRPRGRGPAAPGEPAARPGPTGTQDNGSGPVPQGAAGRGTHEAPERRYVTLGGLRSLAELGDPLARSSRSPDELCSLPLESVRSPPRTAARIRLVLAPSLSGISAGARAGPEASSRGHGCGQRPRSRTCPGPNTPAGTSRSGGVPPRESRRVRSRPEGLSRPPESDDTRSPDRPSTPSSSLRAPDGARGARSARRGQGVQQVHVELLDLREPRDPRAGAGSTTMYSFGACAPEPCPSPPGTIGRFRVCVKT